MIVDLFSWRPSDMFTIVQHTKLVSQYYLGFFDLNINDKRKTINISCEGLKLSAANWRSIGTMSK